MTSCRSTPIAGTLTDAVLDEGSTGSKQWSEAFLGYFTAGGANNGGAEAIKGLIELHRRVARRFRNRENYRLRMLLIGGGLAL